MVRHAQIIYVNKGTAERGIPLEEVVRVFKENNDLDVINHVVEQSADRLYVSWASVDIVDRAGEKIPIEEVAGQQDILLERNGPITDEHTNRVIGQTLAYKILQHPDTGKLGVLHLNKIFNHNATDDKVWEEIQSGKRKGSSVGGFNEDWNIEFDADTGMPAKVLRAFSQYETASVFEPCNPLALNESVSLVAKSAKNIGKGFVMKPFAGYKDFADCVSQNGDKEDPEAYCATIMRAVEKAETADKRVSVINKNEQEEVKEEESSSIIEKNMGDMKMDEEVKKAFSELNARLDAIEKSVKKEEETPKEEEDAPKEEEASEEEEKKKVKKEVDLSGDDVPEDQRPEEENQEDVYKAENDALKKKLDEISKKLEVITKTSTPRPAAPKEEDVKKSDESDYALKLARGEIKKSYQEVNRDFKEKIVKGEKA